VARTASYNTYWTLYGWKCGTGAGGGGCSRPGGRRVQAWWVPGPGATASRARCGNSIRLGGRTYVFYRLRVSCAAARRSVRRLYASGGKRGRPARFICESNTGFRTGGGCHTRRYYKGFGWHPLD